jgi:hypothetical protein
MSSTAVDPKVMTYDDMAKIVSKSESVPELKTACAFLLATLKAKDEINRTLAARVDELEREYE